MTRLKINAVVALGALSLMTLVACGGDDDPSGSATEETGSDPTEPAETTEETGSDPTETTSATEETGSDPAETTSATEETGSDPTEIVYDTEGTISWAITSTPPIWDPHQSSSTSADSAFYDLVYDKLITLGPDMQVVPRLAEEYSLSDDGLTLTFALREDVTFHDGTPFDADVVKANMDWQKTFESATGFLELSTVDEVVVVDDYTVELQLNAPGFDLPLRLASQSHAVSMVNPNALSDAEALAANPDGSGPFILVESAQDRAVYERADSHWDEEMFARLPRRIEILTMPDDQSRLAALTSGQVNVASPVGPVDESSLPDGYSVTQIKDTTRNNYLLVNINNPVLADPLVRQAISMAIDREALSEVVFSGLAIPTAQPFGEGTEGFNPDVPAPVFDPETAARMISDAGAEGAELELMVINTLTSIETGTIIQEMLGNVGLNVTVVEAPSPATPAWREGQSDFLTATFPGQPSAPLLVDNYYGSTAIFMVPPATMPADLQAAHDEARAFPPGSAERNAGYQEWAALVAENPVHIVLGTMPTLVAHSDTVGGFENMGNGKLNTVGDLLPLYLIAS